MEWHGSDRYVNICECVVPGIWLNTYICHDRNRNSSRCKLVLTVSPSPSPSRVLIIFTYSTVTVQFGRAGLVQFMQS